jgi:hypothetical protein
MIRWVSARQSPSAVARGRNQADMVGLLLPKESHGTSIQRIELWVLPFEPTACLLPNRLVATIYLPLHDHHLFLGRTLMATVHNCSFSIIVHDSADVGTVFAERGSRDMTSDMLWCCQKRGSRLWDLRLRAAEQR